MSSTSGKFRSGRLLSLWDIMKPYRVVHFLRTLSIGGMSVVQIQFDKLLPQPESNDAIAEDHINKWLKRLLFA